MVFFRLIGILWIGILIRGFFGSGGWIGPTKRRRQEKREPMADLGGIPGETVHGTGFIARERLSPEVLPPDWVAA